jgi:hypothetical protein
VRLEGLNQSKKLNDLIGNRTRTLLAKENDVSRLWWLQAEYFGDVGNNVKRVYNNAYQ